MDAQAQFVENLVYLMERSGIDTQQKLRAASGVSQAHLGSILRREKKPTIMIMENIAAAFRLQPWQLLAPRHILEQGITPELASIIESYARASDEGRVTILQVAKSLAAYRRTE